MDGAHLDVGREAAHKALRVLAVQQQQPGIRHAQHVQRQQAPAQTWTRQWEPAIHLSRPQ